MDFKKIKKSGTNLTSVLISMLLVIGIFLTMYSYLSYHSTNSGITMQNYSNTTYHLENAKDLLDDNIGDIKSNLGNITEAESGFIVAINGFRGLGNILKLPITFVTAGSQIFQAIAGTISEYTNTSQTKLLLSLFLIGLVGGIVLLVLAIIKGEQQKL